MAREERKDENKGADEIEKTVDPYTGELVPVPENAEQFIEVVPEETDDRRGSNYLLNEETSMDSYTADADAIAEQSAHYTEDEDIEEDFAERQKLAHGGREALLEELDEHNSLSPSLSGGDIDAAWQDANVAGEEAVGGSVSTPDQDVVDELGEGAGLTYKDDEPLDYDKKVLGRDRSRWELNPESALDQGDEEGDELDGEDDDDDLDDDEDFEEDELDELLELDDDEDEEDDEESDELDAEAEDDEDDVIDAEFDDREDEDELTKVPSLERAGMGFDQYHEPPEELSEGTRTYVRVIQSMIEEAEAIDWYVQRLAVDTDEEARTVMSHAQKEEFIHFAIDLEFLLRRTPIWRNIMRNVLFKKGELTELAENAEEVVHDD